MPDDKPDPHDEWQLPNELQPFAARLAAWQPRSDRLNRERLVFLAGQVSVEGDRSRLEVSTRSTAARWAWPASLAAMTAVAATLLFLLVLSSSRERSGSLRTSKERSVAGSESSWTPNGSPANQIEVWGANGRLLTAADAHRVAFLSSTNDEQRLSAEKPTAAHRTISEQNVHITPASWEAIIGELPRDNGPEIESHNPTSNHGASP